MTKLNQLLNLAERATPGPWYNAKNNKQIKNFDYEKTIGKAFNIATYPMRTTSYPISHEMWEANGDLIAAANPQTIKALIEVVLAADKLNIEDEEAWFAFNQARSRLEEIL